MRPTTQYAQSGDADIAYQVLGEGELDLLFVLPWMSQIEQLWEAPSFARILDHLASFSRLVIFDRRGSGLSSRMGGPPTLESQLEDIRAVMTAADIKRAALIGHVEGSALVTLHAATHPEMVSSIVFLSPVSRMTEAPDYPWASSIEERQVRLDFTVDSWGNGDSFRPFAPSMANDEQFMNWAAKLQRLIATPREAKAMLDVIGDTDVREVLPLIQAPTLVLHRPENEAIDAGHARYVAEHVPDAKHVELPGVDALLFGDDNDALLGEIEEFLTGSRHVSDSDRVLATVMFNDIVGSTERAAEMGDRLWRDLLENHYSLLRRELNRFGGNEVKTTGDGMLATFDIPARGIRCARSITEVVKQNGIEVRTGLHTGECELMDNDVGGVAVHIAARVTNKASPSEVLATSTVTDLVAGSGIEFEDRDTHELKGVPGTWNLKAVMG